MRTIIAILSFLAVIAVCYFQYQREAEAQQIETQVPRPQVLLQTNYGDIVVELYNETPLHRDNFLRRVNEGYYDSLLFHRVIENFMIQSGDSTSRYATTGAMIGDETPEELIPAEFRYPQIYHKRGSLAAARTSDDENPEQASSCSQFYIVWGKSYPTGSDLDRVDSTMWARTHGRHHLDRDLRKYYRKNPGTPSLDGSYTVFGEVVSGLEIVDMIQRTATDANDRPIEDIRIMKAVRLGGVTNETEQNEQNDLRELREMNDYINNISSFN